METKDIKVWIIPEGYELDKKQSNERQVVLKKIEGKMVNSWEKYCELMKGKGSCFVDLNGNIRTTNFSSTAAVGEFEDKEDAVAFAALHKLISLRKNWVGKWKPDWTNRKQRKFTIVVEENELIDGVNTGVSCSMSFPTEEMRDEFLDAFEYLLEIAKPLL